MEEKKEIKVRLSTVVYLFIILILVVALGVVYYLGFIKDNNVIANGQVAEKNNNNTINMIENNSSDNSSDVKYTEIIKRLENNDVLSVTDVIKNSDDTYTLKGEIITVDTSKEQITEYPFYKKTGEYKQITVSSDTKCVYSLDSYENKTDTVENVFSNELYFGGCFNFTFENGECISVEEIVTGH